MKKWIMTISVLIIATGLAGCSSNYVIATKDGDMILAQGKPKIDQETGLIGYQDEQGNPHQINGDRVMEIIKR